MREWIKEHKTHVIFGAIGVVFLTILAAITWFGGGTFFPSQKETDWLENDQAFLEEPERNSAPETGEEEEKILVDVKGAVKNPGVYFARPGDRVINVIEQAGGLLEDADELAINFAMKLADEMVIYVPKKGEGFQEKEGLAIVAAQEGKVDGKVNLNRADKSELETLPGVGPRKAEAIIEYRETNGPFKTIEDLMLVSGFGEKTFEKLKDKITVK